MMKKSLPYSLSLILLSTAVIHGAPGSTSGYLFNNPKKEIAINNRILAVVNGEPITVVDIVKKIDSFFDKQFPQYADSMEARFQFYQINWKTILDEQIEKQLILAEAKMLKVEVTGGELGKEMDRIFGPNIVANLDKAHMTYEEAKERVREEMIVRRMMQIRVHSRAVRQISPQVIKKAYEEAAKEVPNEWHYHVISVRGQNESDCAETAQYLSHCLSDEGVGVDALPEKIEEAAANWPGVTVRISEENQHTDKTISTEFKQALAGLRSGEASSPIVQKSRASNSQVIRIFYLTNFMQGGKIPLQEVEKIIESQLLEQAITRETDLYLQKLRKDFPVEEYLSPESDDIFSLKNSR